MNFNYTIKRLVKKADQEQAQQLLELSGVENPNSIQIETLNEIKLAITQSQKKLQLVNEFKNKITKRGLILVKKLRSYPSDHIIRFKEILENQTFLENKLEFLYLQEFLVPQETTIQTYIQTLTNRESLNPSNIEIQDFLPFTVEDFQEKEEKLEIKKPKRKLKEISTQKSQIEIQKDHVQIHNSNYQKASIFQNFWKKFKNTILFAAVIASFKAAIEVKSSHQTEISPSKRERLVNSQSQCSFFYPNFEDNELPIQNLNFFRIPISAYLERCEFQNNTHNLPEKFSYITNIIKDQIQYIKDSSRYPIELDFNIFQIESNTVEFSYNSIVTRSQNNPHINKPTKNLANLYNIDIKGLSYSKENQNYFLILEITIQNPFVVENRN